MAKFFASIVIVLWASFAMAQTGIDSEKPIEISADQLEVQQENQLAVFSGNVVAVQGGITMKSARMLVYYSNSGSKESSGGMAQGIRQIVADGGVFFTSATETARGQQATYDVNGEQITMTGDVVLTREQNVLKGQKLVYNLKTGRSVLGSGGGSTTTGGGGGRVKGLFVPGKN